LRHAEISRLDWKEVRLDRNFIEVTALKSKTASRRLVTIQPNLKAWLAPLARSSGRVQPPNSRKLREASQRRAGIGKWPTNALRHSFASFHLAKFQDAPALALQMGHTTTAMLFAHYREVVTPEAAEAYWKSCPSMRMSIVDNCCYRSYVVCMNVNLGTVFDKFIAQLLKTGMYQSQSEVVREGLRLLKEREDLKNLRLAELRKEIAIGSEQADRGEFVDGEETFAEIRRRSAERKRAKG
jgi:antitoxin ParD1/3/4